MSYNSPLIYSNEEIISQSMTFDLKKHTEGQGLKKHTEGQGSRSINYDLYYDKTGEEPVKPVSQKRSKNVSSRKQFSQIAILC